MPKITTKLTVNDMGREGGHFHHVSFVGCVYETSKDSAIGNEEHFHVVELWNGNVSSSWAIEEKGKEHTHDFDKQEFREADTKEVFDPEPDEDDDG